MEKSAMKTFLRLVVISLLMIMAAPVYSAAGGQAVQIFMCQQDDEASSQDIIDMAGTWLKAAKGVKGGENIEVYIRFPIAAEMGENDFKFIIATPNFAEWGEFTDAYEGSAVAKVDMQFAELADCTDSMIWEGIKIE
jgi:hypothetical protein